MYSMFKKCIYYILAKTKYRIHSPIVYSFCHEVLDNTKWYYALTDLTLFGKSSPLMDQWKEQATQSLKLSTHRQNFTNFQLHLLFKIAQWYQAEQQVEINPNQYLSGLYLGLGNSDCAKYVYNADHEDSKLLIKSYKSFPVEVLPLSHKIMNSPKSLVLIHPENIDQIMHVLETHKIFEKSCLIIFSNFNKEPKVSAVYKEIKNKAKLYYSLEFYNFGAILIDDSIIKTQEFKLIAYRHKPFQIF
jgi:hypothetical protein